MALPEPKVREQLYIDWLEANPSRIGKHGSAEDFGREMVSVWGGDVRSWRRSAKNVHDGSLSVLSPRLLRVLRDRRVARTLADADSRVQISIRLSQSDDDRQADNLGKLGRSRLDRATGEVVSDDEWRTRNT